MKRTGVQAGTMLLGLWVCSGAWAAGEVRKAFVLENGFEAGAPLEIMPLASNGKYKTLFCGVTEETAYAGEKSFKLEVVSEGGSYLSWLIPFEISTDSRARLTWRYQVHATREGRFGQALAYRFPAAPYERQDQVFDWRNSTEGGWERVSVDPAAIAKGRFVHDVWQAGPDDALLGCINGLVLVLSGVCPGETVTIYLDDLSLQGNVVEVTPSLEPLAAARWRTARSKHRSLIAHMERVLQEDAALLSAFAHLPPPGMFLKHEVELRLAVCQSILEASKGRSYLLNKEKNDWVQAREGVNDWLADMAGLSALESQRGTSAGERRTGGSQCF